ncbi:hypothetical protein GCM10027429_30130 [Marivirga atlantica]|uniref:Uncharacterized protein n=1 Tax=Marivirga atlantica TaxID=1548457 RepID=A0A937DI40_9BACT|nr:hypothetical protein [Marivirga atlantica]MBL0766593.1 hypothetical protein [Marivirga atlantica]
MFGKRTLAYLLILINFIWLAVNIYEWQAEISPFSIFGLIGPLFNGGLGVYLLSENSKRD